jgi:hypothetical protein
MKQQFISSLVVAAAFTAALVGCGNKSTNPTDSGPLDVYGFYTDSKTLAGPPHGYNLDIWSGSTGPTVSFKDPPDAAKNGANALDIIMGSQGWGGIGFRCSTLDSAIGVDVSAYKSMHFWIKGNVTGASACLSGKSVVGNAPAVPLAGYGYAADDAWHEISIPLSAWSGVNLTTITLYSGFVFAGTTPGQYAIIDDLWYAK